MTAKKFRKDYEYPKDEVIQCQWDRQDLVATKLEVNYLNQEIVEILLYSDQGGMSRSHSTGILTLFTDTVNSRNPYQGRWKWNTELYRYGQRWKSNVRGQC